MEPAWPTLAERVRGRRIEVLAYDVENGLLRVELEGGGVLLMIACWDACHVVLDLEGFHLQRKPVYSDP
jgi:hypothetical protein